VIAALFPNPANPEIAQRCLVVTTRLEIGLAVAADCNPAEGGDNTITLQDLQASTLP
jgi:hypothetical protein